MKTILSILLAAAIAITVKAQVPAFNSYPDAKATIYLDFDGEHIQGTSWNWSGPINAQPATLSIAQITEIYKRVAEDFAIFDLNITTDSAAYGLAPDTSRMRIVVTPTSQWYGRVGGVSYVGSFTWGDDTPAWVFSTLLENDIKKVAEAISHEAGHTLGLHHQSKFDLNCNMTHEYYGGRGSGQIGWAPIMGVGYYKNLTTWFNGPNAMGCTSFQSDIDVIAGGTNFFGLRDDDHPDMHTGASLLGMEMPYSAAGIINNSSDKDVFKFVLNRTNNFRLSAIPKNVGSGNAGANIDIKVALLNQSADTIGRYNPADLLNVGIDTNLNMGTYYLVVDGAANANLDEYGSLGYYNLSASVLELLPVHRLFLAGSANDNGHNLTWTYRADEVVKETIIETSGDGIHFNFLAKLPASAASFSWKPIDDHAVYYRVKVVIAADGKAFYSNIIEVGQSTSEKDIDVISRIVTDDISIRTRKNFAYQLFDATGRMLQRGTLTPGSNQIYTSGMKSGVLFLRLQHKNETFTEKFIKR